MPKSWLHIALIAVVLCCFVPRSVAQSSFADKVCFERVTKVTHLSTSGANVWVEVSNLTHLRLVAKRAEVKIMDSGVSVAAISLRDKVVIPRHGTYEVLVPLRFKARSTFSVLRLLRRVVAGDTEPLTLSYDIRAGVSVYKRNFSGENIAISKILDNFAISNEMLRELLDKLR